MSSKAKSLSRADLDAHESKRDLAADLLASVRQMKAGKTQVVHSPAIEARERTGLSQSQFAALLGVSARTLQGWEQGRKQPSGAARTLLNIARTNPRALLDVAGKWLMPEAIPEKTDQAERRAEFHDEAERRHAAIVESGETVAWSEMRRYLQDRSAGKAVARPAPRKLAR